MCASLVQVGDVEQLKLSNAAPHDFLQSVSKARAFTTNFIEGNWFPRDANIGWGGGD